MTGKETNRDRPAGSANPYNGRYKGSHAPPPRAVTWTKFRGPGNATFDINKPSIDRAAEGKAVTNATFSAPKDYILRAEGNDNTGSGGGGFQCCWSNATSASA